MARKRRSDSSGDAARPILVAVIVLTVTGTAGTVTATLRSWLSIWWPALTLAALIVVVLLLWRLRVLRRRARALATHQAELDRQIASTAQMSGTQFEHLVARLLRRDGWHDVRVTGGSGDLGADVTARHPTDRSLLVVQCKRLTGRAVGSPDLQRFLGGHRLPPPPRRPRRLRHHQLLLPPCASAHRQ